MKEKPTIIFHNTPWTTKGIISTKGFIVYGLETEFKEEMVGSKIKINKNTWRIIMEVIDKETIIIDYQFDKDIEMSEFSINSIQMKSIGLTEFKYPYDMANEIVII